MTDSNRIKDPITLRPVFEGPHGQAWLVDLAGYCARQSIPRDSLALVRWYIIEAPWAHPTWHSYSLSLVHLRPMLRKGEYIPVIRHVEGATHEFILTALNPLIDRNALLIGKLVPEAFLLPHNFAAQWRTVDDAAAKDLMDSTVTDIVRGRLSPDTDFREQWVQRFGNAMLLQEYRHG